MKYPDGTEMAVGDLIWWNECLCLGHIQHIAETPEEFEGWGLQEPHAFFGNHHPFNPEVTGVAYPPSSFEDEVICIPTRSEVTDYRRALDYAMTLSSQGSDAGWHSVQIRCESGKRIEWIFTFFEGFVEVGRTVVPIPLPP
jgi:hypothetical protein